MRPAFAVRHEHWRYEIYNVESGRVARRFPYNPRSEKSRTDAKRRADAWRVDLERTIGALLGDKS